MKLVMISDTHNMHEEFDVGSGDVIIHAGDATGRGRRHEVEDFIDWFSELDFKHKIFVPGNHEVDLEINYDEWKTWFEDAGINILNDESVTLEGISSDNWNSYKLKFYGSPITPNFGNWAFMKARGEQIQAHWFKIPSDIDVLITHGPPNGILDEVDNSWSSRTNTGCEMLWKRVQQIEPKIHVFGHMHEGAGTISVGNTEYINAAMLDGNYRPVHKPIVRYL